MNDSNGFFSDPKVFLSFLALIISIVSLICTLINQSEQNRRWEKLNDANPEIKEMKMTVYKELLQEEAEKTEWGYVPDIYAKGEATNIVFLPYFLSLHDSTTNTKLTRAKPVFTIAEVESELKRIGHKNKVFVFKYFKPKFVIENMGKTSAYDLSIQVDAKISNQEWLSVFTSNSKISLAGGQGSTIFIDFELPIDIQMPTQINFRITLTWQDIHSKCASKTINSKWTTNDNFWSYDNGR